MSVIVHFKNQRWYVTKKKKNTKKSLRLICQRKKEVKTGIDNVHFLHTWTRRIHMNKCEVVVIRSAGLSTKQQQGSSTHPAARCGRHEEVCISIYYYHVVALWLSPCFCPCVKQYRRSSPGYLQRRALRGRRLDAFCLAVVILFSFQFPRRARVCDPVPWSAGCPLLGVITWRRAWCPGRRPVGGGSRSCCSVSASPRTSWRWTRTRTPFGRTCWETGNGTEESLQRGGVQLKQSRMCDGKQVDIMQGRNHAVKSGEGGGAYLPGAPPDK